MRRLFDIINALQPVHGLILLVVAAIGIFGTFTIGRQIEKSAIESWIRQAELDVAVATTTAQSWLAQSETIISGLALGFRDPQGVTDEKFDDLVFQAEDWNSEFALDAVAIVQRVLRPQRGDVERVLGQPFGHASDPDTAVPDAFSHMIVVKSSETEGPLRPSVDLLTMPELATVATTAHQVPDKAILGPAFTAGNGRLYSLVGISLPQEDRNALLVGRVDLSELIDILLSNYVPEGLVLRISERDNEARADTLLRPIYGPLEAADDRVHTVTLRVTRGQARWNYNWDVMPNYLGGAPTAYATMVQIGGLIVTVLVVYTIGLLSLQNTIIKAKVVEQTKELIQAKALLLRSHGELEGLVTHRTNELVAALNSEKKMKAEAERANQAKSAFLAAMSHELRTPLNAIMGFSDIMRKKALGPFGNPRYEEYANDIFYSGTLLISLVNDVLDLSKIEAGKYVLANEPLNVASQVQASFRQLSHLAEASDKRLTAHVPPDLPALQGDERALTQILNNLLSNALKFTPTGGSVGVTAGVNEGNGVVLSVTDNGIGMSEEDIARALEPFEQIDASHARSREGTGLGLHISASIMKLFGGTLTIDSKVEKGTTVTLQFPPERTLRTA